MEEKSGSQMGRGSPKMLAGIHNRLILLLAAILAPLFIIQGLTFYDRFQTEKAKELQHNLEVARAVGNTFENFVMDIVRQERDIGMAATASPAVPAADLTRLLEQSAKDYQAVRTFYWVGPDGRVLLASDPQAIDLDFSDRDYFKEIKAGREWVVEDLKVSKMSGEPVIVIGRGIWDRRGTFLGMILAAIDPPGLDSVLAVERQTGAGIGLMDSQGRLVYRFPHVQLSREERYWADTPVVSEALRGKEGTAILPKTSFDDKSRLVAVTPIRAIGWVAGAGRREETAMQAATASLVRHGSMFVLTALAAGLGAWMICRSISRPLENITRQLPLIGSGELPALEDVAGPTELKEFALAFNAMLAELRRTDTILQKVSEATPDCIFVKDRESRMLYANPATLSAVGKPAEEVIGRSEAEWHRDPEQAAAWLAIDQEVIRSGATRVVEETLATPGGARFYLSSKSPLTDAEGKVVGLVGISRDITERKRAEEELRQAHLALEEKVRERTAELAASNAALVTEIEERQRAEEELAEQHHVLQTIMETTPQFLVMKDRNGVYREVNPAFCRFLGRPREDIIGRTDFELFPPEEAAAYRAGDAQVMETGNPENRDWLVSGSDQQSWLHVIKSPVWDGSDQIKGVLCSVRDITERKQAEEKLRESEERFQLALKGGDLGMWDWDIATGEVIFNERWAEMLGYRLEEIEPHYDTWESRVHPEDLPKTLEVLQAHLDGKTPSYESEHRLRHTSGEWVWILSKGKATHRDEQGKPLRAVGTHLDITNRKKAETDRLEIQQRLQQVQKSESLNRMAGAIAHNFNNMLSAVLGNLELAQYDSPSGSEQQKYLHSATKATHRAAEISRFMLTYVGQTAWKAELIDPAMIAREASTLMRVALSPNMHIKTNLPLGQVLVKADGVHLTQVLTNLITNAVEAIGEREGTIQLGMDVVAGKTIKEMQLFPPDWEATAERYVCLTVADTGPGMTGEILDNIFDPFFSTKFVGRGMGLPVVLGLMRAYKGAIGVESIPGQGTTFRVYFPVEQEFPLAAAEEALDLGIEVGRLVLVADDEPEICLSIADLLHRRGYEVITAGDGAEAMEIFGRQKDRFSLVILDLNMPEMNGWQVLAAMRALRPDIPVIMTSGFDEAQVMTASSQERPQAFLHKPFGLKELQAALIKAQE